MPRWTSELWRQTIAVAVALPGALAPGGGQVKIMAIWVLFAIVYLALTWFAYRKRPLAQISASLGLGSHVPKWMRSFYYSPTQLAQTAAMAALIFAFLAVPRAKDLSVSSTLVIVLAILAIVVAWPVLHVGFTIHYVSLYAEHGGLEFPGDEEPDFSDFLYFAFTIGTTFGTTDVSVVKRRLRRPVLIHGLLAFLFNTLVIAVTVTLLTTSLS